ncbi:hypothetical protein G9A89_011995 [Geosiphon pyriformis]|nr:hypothetical protein G9A89_011995 [Geosiphon pyriformis]
MLLEDFGLEILVDNQVLPEYSDPIAEIEILVFQRFYLSNKTTYVSILETGKNFVVKVWALDSTDLVPFICTIYVDGRNDDASGLLRDSNPIIVKGFWNSTPHKFGYFRFVPMIKLAASRAKNLPHNTSQKIGDVGTVSVSFYRAKMITPKIVERSGIPLEQILIKEKNLNREIQIKTSFDERPLQEPENMDIFNIEYCDKDPIAVLHIHYRSQSWLIEQSLMNLDIHSSILNKKGHKTVKNSELKTQVKSLIKRQLKVEFINKEPKTELSIKKEPNMNHKSFQQASQTKQEKDTSFINDIKHIKVEPASTIIKLESIENKYNQNLLIHCIPKRKRYREVLVLLSSDDDSDELVEVSPKYPKLE